MTTEENLIQSLSFRFSQFPDARGVLTVSNKEGGEALPFRPDRVFWISDIPSGQQRGMHAHRTCHEALAALRGSFKVRVDNGKGASEVFLLDSPRTGLHIPPMYWCELYDFTPDALCLCLASGAYDPSGYINDYDTFLSEVKKNG